MRKLYLLCLIVLFSFSRMAFSEVVPQQKAGVIANNFLKEMVHHYYFNERGEQINELKLVFTAEDSVGMPLYYIYNVNPDGFVIVGAETAYNPILGYSLNRTIDLSEKNIPFEGWMDSYKSHINYLRNNNKQATDIMQDKWIYYANENFEIDPVRSARENIPPLLPCLWNQNYPYNYFCPLDTAGNGGRVYAGCVATAMSMVMYYHNFPPKASGKASYYHHVYGLQEINYDTIEIKWDHMDDVISLKSPEETLFQVALIQRMCGVAVDMGYSPTGSGAYGHDVPYAVKTHFGYTKAKFESKDSYDKDSYSEWNDRINEQLLGGHPLYYQGYSNTGGHAFCLDGKQGEDMYHFNFGWGGANNGYYYLEGDGAVYGFNDGQAMVSDFYPPDEEQPVIDKKEMIFSRSGVIKDYSNPIKPYFANAKYSWAINPPESNDSVGYYEFSFLKMDLELNDMVRIYDGMDESAPLLGEFSGDQIPDATIKTTGNKAFITFISDGNITEHTGFRLKYSAHIPVYCTGETLFTAPEGLFDDGSGVYNYSPNTKCRFKIKPENAASITLNFNELSLAQGDKVVIYALTRPVKIIDKLDYTSQPTQYNIEAEAAMLYFTTDNLFSGSGFEVSYSSKPVGINEILEDDEMSVYPNPTSALIYVSVSVAANENVVFSLYSLNGNRIFQEQVRTLKSELHHEIDLSMLSKGVYVLQVMGENRLYTRKIVVE